jgi:hypothetical protein
MADKITVYVNRNNLVRLNLYEKPVGESWGLVEAGTVESAVFRFGDFCVDTDNDPDIISLNTAGQAVNLHLGLIPDLVAGRRYEGYLTIYIVGEKDGTAWEEYKVEVEEWPVCSTS